MQNKNILLDPLATCAGIMQKFLPNKNFSLSIHWSWHLTQTSMSIIYQNHLVIYFSRLLGFRHASATFCSGNFIGINMHDFFLSSKTTQNIFLYWTTVFCVIMTNYLHYIVGIENKLYLLTSTDYMTAYFLIQSKLPEGTCCGEPEMILYYDG